MGQRRGRKEKKKGKNSNLPNTFDDDCSIRLFYRLLRQGFCSRFWSPSRTGQVQDKGFFRGPNILDEGEEGGGSLQGYHQLACVQTLPPPPLRKKMRVFFEEGGGGGVCTHRLELFRACVADSLIRLTSPAAMRAIGQNGRSPFSASNSGEANSRNFPGQVEYFFLRLEPRFCCRFIIRWKLCNFALKSFTFFKKRSIYWNQTGFRCSVLLAKNIYKAWKVKENFVAFFYNLKQPREQYE